MPKTSPKTQAKADTKPAAATAAAKPVAAKAAGKGDHIFLVDGSGYIFRAYHALPPLNRKSDGLQVNAVLGFCNMLWKLLRDMPEDNRPTHLAIVFDKSEVTFRNKIYPEYKAHRPPAPEDLIPQFALPRLMPRPARRCLPKSQERATMCSWSTVPPTFSAPTTRCHR